MATTRRSTITVRRQDDEDLAASCNSCGKSVYAALGSKEPAELESRSQLLRLGVDNSYTVLCHTCAKDLRDQLSRFVNPYAYNA